MAHYIDAEKLIAEINKRLMAVALEKLGNFGSHRVWAYNDVKDIIDSLEQEQPEFNIPSAGSGALGTIPPKFKLEVKEQPVEELKELRKEVIKFSQDHFDELHSDMETIDIVHIIARHFAEWQKAKMMEKTISWLKDNANKYIVDIGVGYGEHGRNVKLVVGGKCWDDLKKAMEE